MKPTNQLTELSIKQAKPKIKQYKLTDGEGMYLRVYPNGSKYWQLQFWFEGKQKILSFGVWPDISLKEARDKRFVAKKIIKEGINPIEEKKEILKSHNFIQEEEKLRETTTFNMVAKEWFSRQSLQWTERHSRGVLSSLNMHVYPDLGEMPISSILKQDIISTLRKLEAEGKNETCYRIRQKIEAIFSYAEVEGHCTGNPAKGLQQILTKPQPKSQNSLPISALPEFLEKIIADKAAIPTTVLAMKFIILTFVRTQELRFADWKEFVIDSSEPLWVIPADRMKMRKIHHVPLSRQAVNILNEMQKYSGKEGYVFPQYYNSKKAMSENTLLYFSNRLGYSGRHTIHGFRSVASTVLNESRKWHPDVIERQLAHQESNKVRKAYNRAEHLNERRKMMQWWSDYIESLTVK
ncbi:MAG: integrase arm-type DNA-binding domain-containing protein [Deltaproteobacteria bacterium]|nr:integrase arm-type DNA-binding domain-containing protein [Deltaproteobacteria bacterium]